MKRILPEAPLAELPPEHAVFSTRYPLTAVEYTAKVKATFGKLTAPYLEGIALDGATRVLYSRFDLGCGWENEEHPWAKGVAPKDAVRVGINAVVYALTH
ncbi:MAG: DUF4159 domain-containing protein [Planctomycetes bacterium]|nr:DUF4159 domain-containing protein [Planctomycetota bacterium]